MRREFAKTMLELAEKDPKVFLIILDVGGNVFDEYIKKFPDRFFNLGVIEQASVSFASGLALEGYKPYVYTIAPFMLDRPFEQVKLDIVQQKANVKLFGFWDYPTAGPTHKINHPELQCQALGIPFVAPKDAAQTREKMLEHYQVHGPAFFYITKDPPKAQ